MDSGIAVGFVSLTLDSDKFKSLVGGYFLPCAIKTVMYTV